MSASVSLMSFTDDGHQTSKELEVFYALEIQANMANRQLEMTAVLSNEQLKYPTLQKIFRLKHFVVNLNDAQFQRNNFDEIGLRRLGLFVPDSIGLPLIGV